MHSVDAISLFTDNDSGTIDVHKHSLAYITRAFKGKQNRDIKTRTEPPSRYQSAFVDNQLIITMKLVVRKKFRFA